MSLSVDTLDKTWKGISVKHYASHGVSGGWAQSLVSTSSPFCSPDLLLALLVTRFTEKQVGWHLTPSLDTVLIENPLRSHSAVSRHSLCFEEPLYRVLVSYRELEVTGGLLSAFTHLGGFSGPEAPWPCTF